MLHSEAPALMGHINGDGDASSGLRAIRTRPPLTPPGLLHRGRLTGQLTAAAGDVCTLVSAGPGWGTSGSLAILNGGR